MLREAPYSVIDWATRTERGRPSRRERKLRAMTLLTLPQVIYFNVAGFVLMTLHYAWYVLLPRHYLSDPPRPRCRHSDYLPNAAAVRRERQRRFLFGLAN